MTTTTTLDRANQLGQCICPICKAAGADVCQGKRTAYVVCENCGTLTQTRTRKGNAAILALLGPAHQVKGPDPEPAPAPKPEPKPAPRRSGLADVAALLSGQ
jgi:hypothetical protein